MRASEIITEKRTISKLLVAALISALAASPSYSSDDAVKDAYDLARQIYHAKDLSQAGVEEEAKQEIKNILRSIQGHPNQSKILDIFKNMWKTDVNEYGVGKITAQNATADVKPGDEFKNVKKLRLEHIRKQGDKYVVLSKDGKRKFGTYTSKAQAEKRLRQIEMFKHMGK